VGAAGKKRLGLKFAASLRDLTFRELHLPWALYSMSLFGAMHKARLVGRVFASVCSRGAAESFFQIAHVAATAAKPVARQRGDGRCERPDDVIARARKGGRPAVSRLAGGANVSGSSGPKSPEVVPGSLRQTRAWVINKGLFRPLVKKIFVAAQVVTRSSRSRHGLQASVSVLPHAARLSVARCSVNFAGDVFVAVARCDRPMSVFRVRAGLKLCARY
jgi:hypothetical protein